MASAHDNYLATQVTTASPQKLQLMLIEGALRLAERARLHWQSQQDDAASESLGRAQAILGQMISSIDREQGGSLAERVSAIYEFIYRRLFEAKGGRDEKRLADAVRLLEIERETWRQLCDKLASESAAGPLDDRSGHTPHFPRMADFDSLPMDGFSIEA